MDYLHGRSEVLGKLCIKASRVWTPTQLAAIKLTPSQVLMIRNGRIECEDGSLDPEGTFFAFCDL